jgi:hypothetical protein
MYIVFTFWSGTHKSIIELAIEQPSLPDQPAPEVSIKQPPSPEKPASEWTIEEATPPGYLIPDFEPTISKQNANHVDEKAIAASSDESLLNSMWSRHIRTLQ